MTDLSSYEQALRIELAAIRRIVAALDRLDKPERKRIIRYLVDRYEVNDDGEAGGP